MLTIGTSIPVTIKNLKITGGKNASGNGGGIYMATSANVTLESGSLISENYAEKKGGGI